MQKIDARGKICPLPLFYTKRKIEEIKIGDEVEVIVDDSTAKETIPKWSRDHGHEIVSIEDLETYKNAEASKEAEKCFRIVVRKREDNKK